MEALISGILVMRQKKPQPTNHPVIIIINTPPVINMISVSGFYFFLFFVHIKHTNIF